MFEILFFSIILILHLKKLNRMIVFAIDAFFLIHRHFTREVIMRFEANETLFFISTNFVDVIISLTIKTLLDFAVVDKQFARHLCIIMQKIVFNQTINLLDVVNFYD
jgi:hypothetical protein